jgi:hypothetical protein
MDDHRDKIVYNLHVFADNFQFQLQDQIEDCEYPEYWNDALLTQLFVSGNRIVGIGTVRDLDIDLTLEIYADPMDEKQLEEEPDVSHCDHAAQTNLELPSGKLLITGCTTDYEETIKLDLPAQYYGVRIFWQELDSIDELGFEGEDKYLIQLWPNTYFEEGVIKLWRQLALQSQSHNN